MKIRLLLFIIFLSGGMLRAQENPIAQVPPDNLIQAYLSQAGSYAVLYNGKTPTPYDRRFENHPYFVTDKFTTGTLSYNHVIYKDILMRLDLYMNELAVFFPGKTYLITLEKEKVDYALLNNATIVTAVGANDAKNQYLVLLHDGLYPFVKKYARHVREDIRNNTEGVYRTFDFREQYEIYINGTPYPVKNKKSILKLFPDRKKELNDFAKQHKLNFRKQTDQSMVDLVKQYEYLQRTGQQVQPLQ